MKLFPIRSTEYQVFHLIILEFSQTNQNHEKNGCLKGICGSFNFKKRKSAFFDFKTKLQKINYFQDILCPPWVMLQLWSAFSNKMNDKTDLLKLQDVYTLKGSWNYIDRL